MSTKEERNVARLFDPLWISAVKEDVKKRRGAFTKSNDEDHEHREKMKEVDHE